MRILVTGSRDWPNYESVRESLDCYVYEAPLDELITVVHGGCPTGADYFASRWADERPGVVEECHPADWGKHGKAAGPIRNQHMVDLGADFCVAFPRGLSRGTRHCMKAAAAAGIPVYDESEED